ncbi:MAG: alkaline phytoceramidase [Chromatiales bacterium]
MSRETRIAILWASAATIAFAAGIAPRFAQPADYHYFADQRPMLGIANFLNVTSNLAFLVVGVMGLHFVLMGTQADGSRAFQDSSERWAWGLVFAATALTCCGSWYYHAAPDSPRLAWDRLPMAIGFMGIIAAAVSERISVKAGRRLLIPLGLLGAASVWYWRWSAAQGVENLNPYGAVQFGSALLVLLMIALFPPRYTRGGDFFAVAILYALAKIAEHFDRAIFTATGEIVSGHTLKHLLAAAAAFWLLRMLKLRTPLLSRNGQL